MVDRARLKLQDISRADKGQFLGYGTRRCMYASLSLSRSFSLSLSFSVSFFSPAALVFTFLKSTVNIAEGIEVDELLRYSHKLSTAFATTAPPGWHPEDPRRPYPREMEMGAGALAAIAHLASDRSTTDSET